jgi:nucleoside-diphosphate-sugar epimerase
LANNVSAEYTSNFLLVFTASSLAPPSAGLFHGATGASYNASILEEKIMRVLIVGAAGYIGGSVAARLVAQGHAVAGLTRARETAARLEALGIAPVIGSNTDVAVLHRAASGADVVVNAADVENPYPVATILAALRGTDKRFIQTSGSSVVGDKSAGEYSHQVYHEDTPLDALPEKIVRTAIHRQVLAAAHDRVHSIVLCPPLIYGAGAGLNPHSVQIPKMIKQAQTHGVVRYVGKGEHVWSHVHIDDVVDAYLLALEKSPAGSFYYLENGEANFQAITASIGKLLGMQNGSWTVDEAIQEWGAQAAWFALGSNSRVRADKARRMLGWQPKKSDLFYEIEHGCYRVFATPEKS